MTIFHTLFGAVRGGTIHRIHFFWYIAGLWTVGAAVLMTLSLSIGMQQPMEGLTTEQAQQAARDTLGSIGQVVVIVLGLLFLFAQVNLIAKRIRDTGLPGWLTLVAAVTVTGLCTSLIGPGVGAIVNMVFWITLLFTPPGIFARQAAKQG